MMATVKTQKTVVEITMPNSSIHQFSLDETLAPATSYQPPITNYQLPVSPLKKARAKAQRRKVTGEKNG
jgi:hypothetical protein